MIGSKLKQVLEVRNIKPGTLATITGIPKSTIYSIIKRNNKNVDYSVMEKICIALDVPVEFFYDQQLDSTKKISAPMVFEAKDTWKKLSENFEKLNEEGQEKLLDLSDDLVQSGKYIKSNQNEVVSGA